MWGYRVARGGEGVGVEGGVKKCITTPRKYTYSAKMLANYIAHVSIYIFRIGLSRGVLHI
jgi:hypothetical protein